MRSQGRYLRSNMSYRGNILSMDILIGKHRVTYTDVHTFLFTALMIQSKWQHSQANRSFHGCWNGKSLKSSNSVCLLSSILAACLADSYIS